VEPPETMLEILASTLVASCFPIEPVVANVEVATFHTDAGSAVIEAAIDVSEAPSDEDAVVTIEFVFPFTTAAIELEAVPSAVSVWPFTFAVPALTAAPNELEALVTSDWSASEPDERPAPVSVRVPFTHTSAARVPKVVSERLPDAQTAAGIAVMEDAIDVSDAPSELEAMSVCAFTFVVTPAVAVLVFPLTTAATEVEALCTSVRVASDPLERPAPVSVRVTLDQTLPGIAIIEVASVLSEAPSDEDAVVTIEFVFPFTTAASDEVAVASAVSVCPFTLFVPLVIAAPSELDAAVTSDCTARDPDESPAPVSVRVPFTQTSAASVPKVVRLRVPFAHTAAGMAVMEDAIAVKEEPMDDDAVFTIEFVLALMIAASELVAVVRAVSVWLFTPVVTPAVAVFVFPFTTAATEVEAL
jgi:hypothetical protein